MGKKSLIILGHGVVLDGESSLIDKLCKVKCNVASDALCISNISYHLRFSDVGVFFVLFFFFFFCNGIYAFDFGQISFFMEKGRQLPDFSNRTFWHICKMEF